MYGNDLLIDTLIREGVLKTPRLIRAFRNCDRARFVPDGFRENAYADIPLPIGEGQTISQPTTVAIMLELLEPVPGNKILDIGSGSGWTTALLAHAVGADGTVEGTERIGSLVAFGSRNLENAGITNGSIEYCPAGRLGKPESRFDRILVSASAVRMPVELIDQLKPGGIMVIPVQESLWKVVKNNDETVELLEYPGFRFVPLIIG